VSSVASLDSTLPSDFTAQLVLTIGRTVFTFLPYIALAAFIAVWSKSGGAGIAIGLVVYFAEGIVMSLLVAFNKDYVTIANFGLSRNVSAIARLAGSSSGTGPAAGGDAPGRQRGRSGRARPARVHDRLRRARDVAVPFARRHVQLGNQIALPSVGLT